MSNSPEHKAWTKIRERCLSKTCRDYADYGGRGVVICDSWLESFENFYADMGDKPSSSHSIDRIDVNGNYEPGNCRWATAVEQANNKRSNIVVNLGHIKMTVAEASRLTGLHYKCLVKRANKGLTGAELFEPRNLKTLSSLEREQLRRTPVNLSDYQ